MGGGGRNVCGERWLCGEVSAFGYNEVPQAPPHFMGFWVMYPNFLLVSTSFPMHVHVHCAGDGYVQPGV